MNNDSIVQIKELSKKFGAITAVDGISLDIPKGEFFVLVGPSGSGKTTLLRMLAGFDTPDEGSIFIDGDEMHSVPPNKRPVNMVFQSYALFPHMTVWDNVSYGLKVTGIPENARRDRVADALGLVRLENCESRKPNQLSGGQRQRVALARALVKQPKVLLLDEPLSALDANLREQMRLELVAMRKKLGITFILVTHDRDEALSVADRIAVMNEGRVRQIGAPRHLYEFPIDRFVAGFVGTTNLFDGEVLESHSEAMTVRVPVLERNLFLKQTREVNDSKLIWLSIRPEKIRIAKAEIECVTQGRGIIAVNGVIEKISYRGDLTFYDVSIVAKDVESKLIRVAQTNVNANDLALFHLGEAAMLSWPLESITILHS